MSYDRKNDEVRTDELNSIFVQIAYLNKVSGKNETGQNNTQVDLSGQVELRMPSSNQFMADLNKIAEFFSTFL